MRKLTIWCKVSSKGSMAMSFLDAGHRKLTAVLGLTRIVVPKVRSFQVC
ncbi:hypothetical protein [Vibrio caribbeanicus]